VVHCLRKASCVGQWYSAKDKTGEMAKKKHAPSNPACQGCPALCCKDLVVIIMKPRTRAEIENLKWELQFDTVSVFIRNNRWHTETKGTCIYLDENNMCTIYDRRPDRCRRHNPPDCERFGEHYDVMLRTPEELEAYLAGSKSKRKKTRKLRRKH